MTSSNELGEKPAGPVLTTFYNFTVVIPGDPKPAYARLCKALADLGADWISDTYSTFDEQDNESELKDTADLFYDGN